MTVVGSGDGKPLMVILGSKKSRFTSKDALIIFYYKILFDFAFASNLSHLFFLFLEAVFFSYFRTLLFN